MVEKRKRKKKIEQAGNEIKINNGGDIVVDGGLKPKEEKLINGRPILGYMTNTEHLSEDGKGVPRLCNQCAIVGFAPSSMEDVQFLFGNQDVEVWPLNQLYVAWPRIVPSNRMVEKRNVTRWFQIHHRHSYDQTVARDHSHHDWLAKQNEFPIYMMDREPDIPYSCRFPKEQLLDKFRRYFTNSISWEIALAIYEGFKKIYIFGVDMAQDSEYAFERPSVEFFCGYAEGVGIELIVPEKSDLLKSAWLYPFEDDSPIRTKFQTRRKELRGRLNNCAMQEQQLHDERLQLLGALENMNYVEKAYLTSIKDQALWGEDRMRICSPDQIKKE